MHTSLDLTVFRNLSYGLYIVTSHNGERLNGQIINTAIQVTSTPPRVAVILNKLNLTHELIEKSREFAVSVLDEATPMVFIGRFGFRSGRDIDKLSGVEFRKGITGCPLILDHALSVLEAEVMEQIDLGTHTIFIGNTIATESLRTGRPLTYQYYHEILKGKEPPKAPTYIPSL